MQSLHQFDWSIREFDFLLWEQFKLDKTILNNEKLKALEIDRSLISTLIDQAKRFAVNELDPINSLSDQEGCHLDKDGKVILPSAFPETWKKYTQAGWTELSKPIADKIAIPRIASQAILELFFGANPSFMMYSGFATPIAFLIDRCGSAWQKTTFTDKLLTLAWGGCFCMTEPEAGSDVGNIRTTATKQGDGSYFLQGEKIFITAGMHDLLDNLIYLVVARTKDAPTGTMGLSCFIVPRYRIEQGETSQVKNGVTATRIEKKMGLAGCATTALSFGLDAPCEGYLLGSKEHTGLSQLTTLMSLARMSTGLIALGIASKAYQNATAYAHQRYQGANVRQAFNPKASKVPIIEHADVKRMLLEMKAKVEGCRALMTKLSYHFTYTQYQEQEVVALSDEAVSFHERWVSLLTPLVKAYISDQSWRVSELAIQVYGGHGYIRDNPVEQSARDCKILSIWEGTNFLQSAELIREKCAMGRKSPLLQQALDSIAECLASKKVHTFFSKEAEQLRLALQTLIDAHSAIGGYTHEREIDHIFFNSNQFLILLSETIIGWLLLEGAVIAHQQLEKYESGDEQRYFLQGRIDSMQYFLHYILPISVTRGHIICHAPIMAQNVDSKIF